LSPDEGGVELMPAGLLLVGEMQEMSDVVAAVHGLKKERQPSLPPVQEAMAFFGTWSSDCIRFEMSG
jgi:hypothetical protein